MGIWEQVGLAAVAIAVLVFFGPGVNRMLKDSRKGSRADWLGVAFPIGLVILFVLVLIMLVRH
ncbi:MAG TPA: hypothetical protein ENJ84_11355 [Gammaproteobacteria bacterium]|nr:hypothetical protein [Gammaproteobacteria bacterium]